MAFPETALPIKVELYINGSWTDVTSDVRGAQKIRITRGRSDEGQQVEPTRCSFTLSNLTGTYTPRNPEGVHYGYIGRNTPCRVSVLTGDVYLDLPGTTTGYASTPDAAALDIVGDIDVRLDATFANWLPPATTASTTARGSTVEMMGKLTAASKSWFLGARDGLLYFEWSADGSTALSASSTVPPPIPGGGGRLAIRATIDVDNGAAGRTITFWTAETLDSPWTQLGEAVVQAGTTSIFNSTSTLRVGNATDIGFTPPIGRVHSAEVRNGIWGTAVANPYFSSQSVGATSFADAAGLTWTINSDASITNRKTRFTGEVSAWNVRWENRFDIVTEVEAAGIMRRLTQGASPVRSPMHREFTNPARANIKAYWPMEDEASATAFASGFDGQAAMTFTATGVTPAAYTDWDPSAALPTITSGKVTGRPPAYTATSYIFIRFFAAVPAAGVSFTDRLFSFTQTGTARTWTAYINTSGNVDLRAYDVDNTQILSTGFTAAAINGTQRHIGIELTQDGADIDYQIVFYALEDATLDAVGAASTSASGTLAGYTVGSVIEVRVGESGGLNGTAIGHIAVADDDGAFADTLGALVGWEGEPGYSRIFRLGTEEDIPAYPAGVSDQEMGLQGRQTFLALLREAEATDGGILCEQRDFLGFRLRDRVDLYNQMPTLTLDYSGDDGLVTPLTPTDDDQRVRNDVTVQRSGGSSTRDTLTTGTLSTQAPPDGVGTYDESVTLSLYADGQTDDFAGWRVHLGTWDESRYPTVKIMLEAAPSLIDAASDTDTGDRIQITNPPDWLPTDTIDLQVQGYSESFDQFTWNIEFNCAPAGPWDVAWTGADTAAAGREFAWADTAGSSLAEALTSTETDVDVLTASGPRWTDDVTDTPYDLRVGGEVMTVTAPGGLLNDNAFFDTDTTGWTQSNSTIARSQTYVCPHPRATASLRVTPDGASVSGGANCTRTPVDSITPGATYTVSMWVFSVDGWSDLRPAVDWYTSADAFISSGLGSATVVASSVWTYIEQTLTAPATASRAAMRARHGGTPAATDVYYVWAARITRVKASWLYDDFGRTVSLSWSMADSSQTWAAGGGTAADYAVGSGYGSHTLATVNASRRSFTDFTYADFDYYVDVTTSATATGGSLMGGPTGRYNDSDNLYMARVEFTTANAVILTIRERVAGVESELGTFTSGITHTAGTFVRVRFQVSGTTLRAKVWRVADWEPDVWHISVTDSSITTSTYVGVRSIASSANTNVSPQVRYQNLELVSPQTYTVTRSQNDVVKTHAAGADDRLGHPAITAL